MDCKNASRKTLYESHLNIKALKLVEKFHILAKILELFGCCTNVFLMYFSPTISEKSATNKPPQYLPTTFRLIYPILFHARIGKLTIAPSPDLEMSCDSISTAYRFDKSFRVNISSREEWRINPPLP